MKQIVVISGKGGTGKTSITAALAGLGSNKVLADCDVDAADLHLLLDPTVVEDEAFYSGESPELDTDACTRCGLCREHCRFGAVSEDLRILPEHCEGCGVCAFVCPAEAITMEPRLCGRQYRSTTRFGTMIHAALGIGEENSGKLVTSVRNASAAAAEDEGLDLVLVDGPPGVGCPVIASLTGCDMAVIVAEPTVSAVHDMQRVHELTRHFRIPAAAVVNKSGINPEQEQRIRDYCAGQDVPVAGAVPYDKAVTRAQIERKTIIEYDPDGVGQSIRAIWENLERHL